MIPKMTIGEVLASKTGPAVKLKRIDLRTMQKHDIANHDCAVRELEMEVDAALDPNYAGYTLQFWRDVNLYGVDEAILYVRNGKYGDADRIQKRWLEKIRPRIVAFHRNDRVKDRLGNEGVVTFINGADRLTIQWDENTTGNYKVSDLEANGITRI